MKNMKLATIDASAAKLSNYFNRHYVKIDLSPEFEETVLYIEKKSSTYENESEHVLDNLHFDCEYGGFRLINSEQLIRGITGVSISGPGAKIGDRLSHICGLLPHNMKEMFGWVSPTKVKKGGEQKLRCTLRIQSRDLVLVSTVEAGCDFWNRFIAANSNNIFSKSLEGSDQRFEVPITVGLTSINFNDVSSLVPGDVLLLDETFMSHQGDGSIIVEGQEVGYRVTSMNGKKSIRISSVTARE